MNQSYKTFVDIGLIKPTTPKVTTPSISTGFVYSSDGTLGSASALNILTKTLGAI
jgi:hypothetical protein